MIPTPFSEPMLTGVPTEVLRTELSRRRLSRDLSFGMRFGAAPVATQVWEADRHTLAQMSRIRRELEVRAGTTPCPVPPVEFHAPQG